MNNSSLNISKLFKEYRKSRKFTQKQLADTLGIAQATISLIEGGSYKPSQDVLDKILNLYEKWSKKDSSLAVPSITNLYTKIDKGTKEAPRDLNIYYYKATKGRLGGGDVFEIHKISNSEIVLFIADAVGHGDEAYLEAQMLRVSFISIMTAQPRNTNPLDIIMSIRLSLKTSSSAYWSRNSLLVAYINTEQDLAEIRSYGVPMPILSPIGKQLLNLPSDDNLSKNDNFSRGICPINRGDAITIYTDGLIDSGENRKRLEQKLNKYNEMFPGDSKNILEKSIDIDENYIKDDVTVVVISRK